MLIEEICIKRSVGGFWAVFVDLGVCWAVFKVEFLRECGISSGNAVQNPLYVLTSVDSCIKLALLRPVLVSKPFDTINFFPIFSCLITKA